MEGRTYSDGIATTIIQTTYAQKSPPEQMKSGIIQQTIPDSLLQKFIDPAEIASFAAYLASPLSVATDGDGASFRADGGVLKQV